MGGIVKSIGKAIKGIGKALKKIAPILLVAAAVYIGYGYMTGFQSGGWPKIINWGKSLIGGVQQGQTISQAATAATDMTAMAGAETAGAAAGALDATAVTNAMGGVETGASTMGSTFGADLGADAVTTGLGAAETAVSQLPVGDVVAGGAPDMMGEAATQAGGLGTDWATESIAQTRAGLDTMYGEFGTGWQDVSKGITNSLTETGFTAPQVTMPAEQSWWSQLNPVSSAEAHISPATQIGTDPALVNRSALDQVMSDRFTSTGFSGARVPQTPGLGHPGNLYEGLITAAGETEAALGSASLPGKIASLGKKAWGIYKKMWADNPGMAMWTTNNVLRTILAMLDDTDEKESWRASHVGGFAPGGYDEVAKRYKGNLPGGRGGGRGYTAPRGRSNQIKTGPVPEAERGRSSAIDSRSPGMIGSTQQGVVK
tara:strand:+ start:6280 stop:7566 length:1287 start_codon:yes stop_codon:yes gene_type:complete